MVELYLESALELLWGQLNDFLELGVSSSKEFFESSNWSCVYDLYGTTTHKDMGLVMIRTHNTMHQYNHHMPYIHIKNYSLGKGNKYAQIDSMRCIKI